MKILWIGPNYRTRYNRIHEALPDAVRALCPSDGFIRYGKGLSADPSCEHWGHGTRAPELVERYRPDILVVQHPRHCQHYMGLGEVEIPKVCIVVDYFPRNYAEKNAFITAGGFDVVVFSQRDMIAKAVGFQQLGALLKKTGFLLLPFWADTERFHPDPTQMKRYDAMALFSVDGRGSYPNRVAIVQKLKAMKAPVEVFARTVYDATQRVTGPAYVRLIQQSRMAVTSCDAWGSVNFKHFEYAAAGTLMITDVPRDFEALGFRPSEHYVPYAEPKDVPSRVLRYIWDEAERHRIEANALELVRSRHTVAHRARKLIDLFAEMV